MHIIIAGGTGFIGQYLRHQFVAQGHQVTIISRTKGDIQWHAEDDIIQHLSTADVLINLAGKSVDCRYTKGNKQAILSPRLDAIHRLESLLAQCSSTPALWINASTATIYRHALDRPMDEVNGDIGTGFSVDVATAWEQAFFNATYSGRKVALRIAIVLGPDGGVIQPYQQMVKYGLGGHQGNGLQKFSFIHIHDLYRIITYCMMHADMEGVYNASSPFPADNHTLMHLLRKYIQPHFYLPMPKWLLEIGAYMIRTETELILKSRWVLPKRLLAAGFTFQFPTLDETLASILNPATQA